MNNRLYYKAKEKGPEGPRGFSIKGGIQAYAKGVKKATWVFNKPPKRGIKTYAKRGQRATWVFNKPPAKGDQNLANLS
jgi:hypothetical protein